MSFVPSVLRTLAFVVAYMAATYAGRLTVMDETNLSLVWPAAGVSAVWGVVQYRSRWRILDVLALCAATAVINMATGASASLVVWFAAANVTQAAVFAWLVDRWLPQVWGGGGTRSLSRLPELWRVTAAAFISTACGALLGPTGVWVVNGVYSWPATAVWLTRNTVSILLIGAAGIRIGAMLHAYRRTTPRAGIRAHWAAVPLRRRLEYVTLVTLSAVVYVVVFGAGHQLPLAFMVVVLTIWAGLRLHTTFVALHDLVFGSVAVLFTLHGTGQFAQIESHAARAMVAQAFVGMIALVGLALAIGRDERRELVAQLRAAEHAAARQARMMSTIVDSMAEGLTVVDAQGRFLLRNPAVRRLVGGVVSASDRIAKPDFYGLFHPDGRPLAPDEMPYRRALAGRDVRNMDILVRNPGVPEGRLLSVSATALPGEGDGTRYAVSVFHDVTAERRHRNELASFAGVVAHDLQNPLTTVEGWSEALAEMIEEAADQRVTAPLADPVRRIHRAAGRMRNMINDLLEYTTARDATMSPAPVDLGELVNDIAMARIDQAQSNDTPVPTFRIGELHPVHADPVLVRQLFENLIGNAIKYTAPGVVPHIVVGTGHADAIVTVTIDDNGVGIPDGQHEAVFDDFHRAHRSEGYAGTGLGLGICKRVVQRHGGTIHAAPNPAGRGTRITVTLPADASALPAPEPDEAATRPPDQSPAPAPVPVPASVSEAPTLAPAATFEFAAHLVLDYLHEQMPLAFWAVTRVENGRQTYLYLDPDNGYGLRQGDSHPWEASYCIHMAAGTAPAVARDARSVPAYANAGVNDLIDIGTYAGVVITEPDGTLFGAICGLDPQTHTGDPRMVTAEPLLALLGQLLTTVLAADRAQNRSSDALLREQLSAETDALTGLPNRRAWQRAVQQAETRYARLADPTVIAMLDLDGLKAVNDTRGHAAGDAYLVAAAIAVQRALRESDVVARLGGDEFGLLLTHCPEDQAPLVVARVHAELEAAGVEGSIGWAAVTMAGGFAGAVEQADAAMYATKIQRREQRSASR
ncbi:diguanylate cyclase domain-containing protein [Actinoplanes sp. DH11]|uniref:diguanylate cyclase domain-containing protein n=1 Tax=Actinoplanes sp. DH11 TaxID=2857011 RepID=UPI001E301AC1|nr:diguanylate cyclase [Actinoplanes sp. DH11]